MEQLKTDRGLLKLILLSIITLGIYGLYFEYKLIKDVNKACTYDGKHTKGVIAMVLLTLITLGIYAFVYYYGRAERINAACTHYGVRSEISGSTMLLWMILGSFIAIGPLVARYLEIKSMNTLCAAYNKSLQPAPQVQ